MAFGGTGNVFELIRDGSIKGIATIIGCSSPKMSYEHNPVAIAARLIRDGVLVIATGCSAHALLNAGLCSSDATIAVHPDLRAVCKNYGVPAVLAVGGCIDNVRTLRLFTDIALAGGIRIHDMPYMVVCPEPGNEKSIGIGLAFLCHGISGILGVSVPAKSDGSPTEMFSDYRLRETLGAALYAETDPGRISSLALKHLSEKRDISGWN